MLIANPIMDTVFKYLLEDNEIAIGILSRLTKLDIISLELKPTELAYEKFLDIQDKINDQQKLELNQFLRIYRFDFKAIIKEKNNQHKVILIEIQKSDVINQLGRFREYLGENYKKKELIVNKDGKTINEYVEIICIYFLNTKLDNIPVAIMRKDYTFYDCETEEHILLNENYDSFVKLLNHKAIYIQIPRLTDEKDTQLRQLFDIFNQNKKIQREILELGYGIDEIHDELKKRIVERLAFALMDNKMKAIFKHEAELDEFLTENVQVQKELKLELLEKDKTIEQKDKTIEQNYKNSILSLYKFIKDPQQIATELGIDVEMVNKVLKK